MPEYLAPGVFVEETTFRQKTIEGVGTSTAAFVGAARFGPIRGEPELLTSFEDYQRIYAGMDQLVIGGDDVDNHLAHAVRAFFENGGRRVYVTRVIHSDVGARPATASGTISPAGPGGSPRLDLAARYAGRAGNFQLKLTVRIGRNILDPAPIGGGPPVFKGAAEYDTVLADRIAIDGVASSAQFLYLRDAFDATADVWTYELRQGGNAQGLVTNLDTAVTTDVRPVTVDVEVRELGEFLQPEFWPGLALHSEHPRSLHATFSATRATRSMELYVPLVVSSTPANADGSAIAEVLLATAGALDDLRNTVYSLAIDATGGQFTLRVDGVATAAINHPATAAEVQSAIEALVAVGPGDVTVADPAGGPYTITFQGALGGTGVSLTADGVALTGLAAGANATLQPFDVTITVPAAAAGTFRIVIDGTPTGTLDFDAATADVQAAVDAVLDARPDTAAGDITVAGAGPFALTVPGALGETALAEIGVEDIDLDVAAGLTAVREDSVYEVEVTATGGTFALTVNGVTTAPLAHDASAADVSAALDALAGVGAGNAAVITPPGGPYTITFEGALAGQPVALTADGGLLVGAAGTATVTPLTSGALSVEPGASSLLSAGNDVPAVTARLSGGTDGSAFPDPLGHEGTIDPGTRLKSGLKAFEDLPDVSIVAAPGSTYAYATRQAEADTIIGLLISHAERMRYRIAVVDSPPQLLPGEALDVRGRFDSKHAAFYYPWVTIFDPVTRGERNFPPSGFVAGIYARNDIERGVHKAPANEVVRLAIGFELSVSTAQQELLNPEGVNCFRNLDRRGRRLWGARTMTSDPEWKYVNLRRYFAFLESSIDRGTQWAVFEPNGERLWANVQMTVADFLFGEFVDGHLLGATPEEAFFVRCDRSTMTQNDLDNGRLVCLIGVCPLRPAEFVIFRIGQKTLDAAGS